MADLLICSAAETEFAESLRWYAERNIEAAIDFDAEFDRAIGLIGEHPERYPRCDDRHRFFLMRRFPFQIIYRIQGETVVIIAVAHTARQPDYWTRR